MSSLFLLLGVFYLYECVVHLSPGQRCFSSLFGNRFKSGSRLDLRLLDRFHVTFPAILPALGGAFVARGWEAIPHPDGVCWRDGGRWRFLPYREIGSMEARSREIRINDRRAAVCRTPEAARQLCRLLGRLSRFEPERRRAAVKEFLGGTLDRRRIDGELERFQLQTGGLRQVSGILALFLFAVMPLEAWYFGAERIWVVLLLQLGVLQAAVGVCHWRAERGLHPKNPEGRLVRTVGVVLWPPAALRSLHQLGLPLLEAFDALAVAHRLCGPEEFAGLAARVVLDTEVEARQAEADPDCPSQVASWFRDLRGPALRGFLASNGLEADGLAEPPEPDSGEAKAYCPRCRVQFRRGGGDCPDCGLVLRSFN